MTKDREQLHVTVNKYQYRAPFTDYILSMT